MEKALIITPTGAPMFFDDAYDRKNHWRYAKGDRTYETCVVGFKSDYVPEPESYDYFFHYPIRHKWKQLPELLEFLNTQGIYWYNYDYVGYWDDDYCTDIQSVNKALMIARERDFRLFQQSLISWTGYDCLKQNTEYAFTETNFIEMGVPFYRADIFKKVLTLVGDYKYNESEWGIDKVLCYYLRQTAHVVHECSIKHMRRESWYDKTNAFREMEFLMREWFPQYMKKNYGIDYAYTDVQETIAAYKRQG